MPGDWTPSLFHGRRRYPARRIKRGSQGAGAARRARREARRFKSRGALPRPQAFWGRYSGYPPGASPIRPQRLIDRAIACSRERRFDSLATFFQSYNKPLRAWRIAVSGTFTGSSPAAAPLS